HHGQRPALCADSPPDGYCRARDHRCIAAGHCAGHVADAPEQACRDPATSGRERSLVHPRCHTSGRCPVQGDRHGRRGSATTERNSVMKLVVIGGTGLIGSKLVARLREQEHEAVAASPESGVKTLTGQGLAEALDGASVVVDVSNSPSFEDDAVMDFFTTSTRNLIKAATEAGVRHYVALSVVGTDRLSESGY